MIKKIKENYKELLLISILYSSYLNNKKRLKNPTLVNILQEYRVIVVSKLDEMCHFGLEIRLSVNE